MVKWQSILQLRTIKFNIEKLKLGIILLVCMLAVGCAGTKNFLALPDAAKQQIKSSKFVLVHSQDELNAAVNKSNMSRATGGGLLFVLIDAAVTNKRANETENLLAPIRSELINFDMDKEIKQAILPVVSSTPWLYAQNISDITIAHGNYPDIVKQISNDATNNKDVVGVFSSVYILNANFTTLEVAVEFYPLSPNLKNLQEYSTKKKKQNQPLPIYKINLVYNKNIETKTNNAKENAKLWAANNGQAIKNALQEAVTKISLQLNKNLQNPENLDVSIN